MDTVYVIKAGGSYEVGRGTMTWLEDDDILGMPDLERYASRGAQQDGDTDEGFTLLPRFMNLVFGVVATTPVLLWQRIRYLTRVFKPEAEAITLAFTTDDGLTRYIDCHAAGGLKLPSVDRRNGIYQKVGVVLKANEAVFYHPTLNMILFDMDEDGMPVPTPVPTPIGNSALDKRQTISYGGTWRSYPMIRIFGPISDAAIYNLTTGERIGFEGVTISSGDYYEIDCRYDYKSVVDAAGDRQATDDTSDLATFHIEEAIDGSETRDNLIRATGNGVTGETHIHLTWYTRYLFG